MFYRGLAILLCSCLIAGSVPQTAAAKESVQTHKTGTGIVTLNEEGEAEKKEEDKKDEEPKPEPEPEPKPEPEPEPKPEPEPEPKPEPQPTQTKTEEKPEGTDTPPQTEAPPETSTPTQAPPETEESPEGPTQTQTQGPTETETQTETQIPTQTQTETEERPESPSPTPTQTETQTQSEEKSEPRSEEESKKPESSKVEESKKEKESKPEKTSVVESLSAEESSSEEKSSESEEDRFSKTVKSGQSTDITLKSADTKEQFFKFKAPSAGWYNFYVEGADVANVRNTIYDSIKEKNQIKQRTYQDKVRYLLLYLEKGQTVYPAISLGGDAGTEKTVRFGVKKAAVASVQETDGGYTATVSSLKANIGWRPASRTIAADITISGSLESGQQETYLWQIVYGNPDVGYTYAEETVSLNSKKEKNISGLTHSQDYSFTMYLLNSSTKALEAVLVSDAKAIKLKTGASRDNVVFRNIHSTYDSITIDIEAVDPVTRIQYGPLAEYEKEVSLQKYISGLGQVSVSGLEPATTYYFEFYNAGGVVTAYTTVDTKEYPAQVHYVIKETGPDSISVRADITAYDGEVPSSFNLCYEILDESGKTLLSGMEKTDTKGLERWSIEAKAEDLEASTRYTVRAWINEPGYTGHFKETAATVTTAEPPFPLSAVKVNIVKNNTKSYAADYTITIEDYLKSVSGKFKYRMKDSLGEYEVVAVTVRKGKVKGTIKGLQEGAEYEYEVRLSGVVKRGTFKIGKSPINPELSADTGAYDSIISYRLKSAELKKATAYSVKLYYYNPETKLYAEAAGKVNLTASQDYTASMQAADLMMLSPNTQYGFKWELYAGSALTHTIYQLVTTEKSEVSVEITANTTDAVNYNIGINGRTEHISNDITLFTYIREEDGEYRRYGDSFNLYKSKDYKTDNRMIVGLDDNKTYTVSFRDIKGGEYGTFTFTFEAKIDGVMMGVTSLLAGAHNFVVQASIEGETDFENQYAVLFFKEKEEEDWDIRSSLLESGQTACGFELTSYLSDDLNADTIYEFVMGVSDTAFPTTANGLKGTYSGEVLTQADARSLTNVSANSGYSYISLKGALTNNPINTTSYIYVFYKEADEWEWIKSSESFIVSDTTGGMLTFIKGLKSGTEYDYIVAVSDSGYNTSLFEIEEDMQQSGSITTKSADIALEITADEERSTAGCELLTVKAAGAQDIRKLKAVLTISGMDGEQVFTKEADLSEENGYTAELRFEGLSPETAYTVTDAELKVMETVIGECYAGTVAHLTPQYSFTTKSVQLPERIDISQEQLNLLYDTSVSLSAQVVPSDASAEVVWSSSDESVARVDADGTVHAVSQGEAVITAASAYSAEIFTQCSVCVKSYAVVEKSLTGDLGKSIRGCTIYKGDTCGIALCEVMPDGTRTEISGYTVQSDKPSVADLSQGMIRGLGVGKTGITLCKDGIDIRVEVRVEAAPERFEIAGLLAKDGRYPAIKNGDMYEIALKDGIRYEIAGAISPSGSFDAQMFDWSVSDNSVLEVTDRGVIIPLSAGEATVTVTPPAGGALEGQQCSFQVCVKPVPEKKTSQIVIDNTKKEMKLEDIVLSDYLGEGWEWKNPKTTIYRLSEDAQPYTFEAVYTGAGYYAGESSIRIYYGNSLTQTQAQPQDAAETQAPLSSGEEMASGEAPEVSVKEITVNTAYNYMDSSGKALSAAQYGMIEIAASEGQYIKSVKLTDDMGIVTSDVLEVCDYGVNGYLIRPVSQELSQGTYKCRLKVVTNDSSEPYLYPMKVKVINKKPALSAKITKSVNLFYTTDKGQLSLMPEIQGMEAASLSWEDALEGTGNGFAIADSGKLAQNGAMVYDIVQENIAVLDGKPADDGVTEGTLTVALKGVREAYSFELHIKTCYEKPKLKLTDYHTGAGSSIVSDANGNEAAIKVYDLTQERMLRCGGTQYGYDDVRCENDAVVIDKNKGYYSLRVSYGGNARLSFLFSAKDWRDTVRAEYTIKNAVPSAVADKDSMIFNSAYSDKAAVNISLKNCAGEARLSDVVIEGANKKSQKLMEDNFISLVHDGSSVNVSITGTGGTGCYTYKLTPYYTDASSGERRALNTLKLRVWLIDGKVRANTETKRIADDKISVNSDFSNLGDSHRVKGARLVGEYGGYFTLQRDSYDMSIINPELCVKAAQPDLLKTSKTYKMSVVYTIETGSGETYEVESRKFRVRLK